VGAGGGPTPDKPDISVVDHEAGSTVSSFMNLRVADIQACYEQWRQSTGLLHGQLAKRRPEDLPS